MSTVKKMDLSGSPRVGLRKSNLSAMCPDWGTTGAHVRTHKTTGTSPRRIEKEETMYGSMGEREGGCSRAHVPGEGFFDGTHPLTDSSGRMTRPRWVRDEAGRVCGCRI